MTPTKKIIISSKSNLQAKYGSNFPLVESLLQNLINADAVRNIETKLIYIDDTVSAANGGITVVSSVNRRSCKRAVDEIHKKISPAYLVIFGSQDVFPFQELKNPVPSNKNEDSDVVVPSDLPYACDAAYNTDVSAFIGPTRVLGRIPDITGKADIAYVTAVINSITEQKSLDEEEFLSYFSVTAEVWKGSTRETLNNIFGNSSTLNFSPPTGTAYTAEELKPMIHFYNCHGSPVDPRFYGQDGNNFPVAMASSALKNTITPGTVATAECCYGAELYNPANEDSRQLGIANTYLGNKAIAFVGSSNIAYGPADGQGLADLVTQYFIKNVLAGASTGRAFLEAQQNFLTVTGPQLDPYELKTLAQFCLLGDPSLQPVIQPKGISGEETIDNRRLNLFNKGSNLADTIAVSKRVTFRARKTIKAQKDLKGIFLESGFTGKEKEFLYKVKPSKQARMFLAKNITGNKDISFRIYIKPLKSRNEKVNVFKVLVLKQSGENLLGWKTYSRK